MHLMRKLALIAAFAALVMTFNPAAAANEAWAQTVARARGQTVYWQAWGGDETVNNYIVWATNEVGRRFGITLRHVKIADTSEAVTALLAERAAGRTSGGRIDLLWLN